MIMGSPHLRVKTKQGHSFYRELERTWNELADAVKALAEVPVEINNDDENQGLNQINTAQ